MTTQRRTSYITDVRRYAGKPNVVMIYGNSTTTLKNLNKALFSSVTVCHSPPSVAAPMMTARAPGTFHSLCAGSKARFFRSGVPSAFIGNALILNTSIFCGSSPTTYHSHTFHPFAAVAFADTSYDSYSSTTPGSCAASHAYDTGTSVVCVYGSVLAQL